MSIIKRQHTVAVLNTTSTVNDIFWPKCTSKTCFKLVASSYWISWSTFYLSNLIQYLAVFLLWHVDLKASFCQVRSIESKGTLENRFWKMGTSGNHAWKMYFKETFLKQGYFMELFLNKNSQIQWTGQAWHQNYHKECLNENWIETKCTSLLNKL